MMLSRSKPAISEPVQTPEQDKKFPTVESFIKSRDYLGAITILEVGRRVVISSLTLLLGKILQITSSLLRIVIFTLAITNWLWRYRWI